MKKFIIIVYLLMLLLPTNALAKQGCCSRHGGVSGCSANGRTICNDGTLSPSCTCTPPVVYGCTDRDALNYNSNATKDNGSCKYAIKGCTDKKAFNYDSKANTKDGSCLYEIEEILEEEIPYETEYEDSEEIDGNEEKTIQEGIPGIKKITYKKFKDEKGTEISSEITKEEIASEPIVEIIQKGVPKPNIINEPTEEEKEEPNKDNTNQNNNQFEHYYSDKTTKNDDSEEGSNVIYTFSLFTALILTFKKHESNTIVNHIKKISKSTPRFIVYLFYISLVIPVLIDVGIIAYSYFSKTKKIEK